MVQLRIRGKTWDEFTALFFLCSIIYY